MNDPRNNVPDIDAMLSAYVDGELDFADRRRVEELIKRDPVRAQEVEELRLLKRWLQDLPTPTPRRSFTLDPATAPRPRRLVFPTLRWATAVAAVLLMLTVSVDVLNNLSNGFGGAAGGATSTSADAQLMRGAASASSAALAQDVPEQEAQEAAGASASMPANALVAPSASAAAPASGAPAASASAEASASSADAASGSGAAASAEPDTTTLADANPSPSGSFAAAVPEAASPGEELGDANTGNSASASIAAAPSLPDTDTTAPNTIGIGADETTPTPFGTLRIAQLGLLIATAALGAGAWFARRRNI